MKSSSISNNSESAKSKMTLRNYFKSLPPTSYPRQDFLKKIMKKTGCPYTTVRSWFLYGIKPREQRVIDILREETGIAPEDMWEK